MAADELDKDSPAFKIAAKAMDTIEENLGEDFFDGDQYADAWRAIFDAVEEVSEDSPKTEVKIFDTEEPGLLPSLGDTNRFQARAKGFRHGIGRSSAEALGDFVANNPKAFNVEVERV